MNRLSCWEIINHADDKRLNRTKGLGVLEWTLFASQKKLEGDVLSLKSKGGSGSKYKPYITNQGAYSCTCRDHKYNKGQPCKHVLALAQVFVGQKKPIRPI